MKKKIAIVGAGVSGLTCGVLCAEAGYRVTIFAEEAGEQTTSAAAAAIWYPYDALPADKTIAWALETYRAFEELSRESRSGVSMIELRTFARAGEIKIPPWACSLGAHSLPKPLSGGPSLTPRAARTSVTYSNKFPSAFASGFALTVPLIDTTVYLAYLRSRFLAANGEMHSHVRFARLEEINHQFDLIINCAGIGARRLVHDLDLEPHRGQVAIVPKLDLPHAIVSDDPPLMYAIPRAQDCVFGGTNDLSDERAIDPAASKRIVAECSRILGIAQPEVTRERVGLRPFRKSGIRLETDRLSNLRPLIHNYGHGGAGFTLSWSCGREVLALAARISS